MTMRNAIAIDSQLQFANIEKMNQCNTKMLQVVNNILDSVLECKSETLEIGGVIYRR